MCIIKRRKQENSSTINNIHTYIYFCVHTYLPSICPFVEIPALHLRMCFISLRGKSTRLKPPLSSSPHLLITLSLSPHSLFIQTELSFSGFKFDIPFATVVLLHLCKCISLPHHQSVAVVKNHLLIAFATSALISSLPQLLFFFALFSCALLRLLRLVNQLRYVRLHPCCS